jgi:hypothetical protein
VSGHWKLFNPRSRKRKKNWENIVEDAVMREKKFGSL